MVIGSLSGNWAAPVRSRGLTRADSDPADASLILRKVRASDRAVARDPHDRVKVAFVPIGASGAGGKKSKVLLRVAAIADRLCAEQEPCRRGRHCRLRRERMFPPARRRLDRAALRRPARPLSARARAARADQDDMDVGAGNAPIRSRAQGVRDRSRATPPARLRSELMRWAGQPSLAA